MASLIQWTWVWVNSGSWWWTGKPGVLQFMGSQRVRHDWVTELNWTAFFIVQFSHPYMTTGGKKALTWQTFIGRVISLLFNMPSRLVIVFLPRSKCLLISWLQSPSPVTLEPKKVKSLTVYFVSPSICLEMMGQDAMILVFLNVEFKTNFTLSSFTFIKRLFSSSSLSAIKVVSSAYLRLLIFSWQSWFQLGLHPGWHLAWCILHIS